MATKENILKVLHYFRGIDNANPLINAPQKQNEYYYATNGNALIRLSTDIDLGIVENPKAPNYKQVIPSKEYHLTKPIEIDVEQLQIRLRPVDNIAVCKSIKCDECENGRFDHGTHTYDCLHCDGTGTIDGDVVKYEKDQLVFFSLNVLGDKIYITARLLYYLVQAAAGLEINRWKLISGSKNRPLMFSAENAMVLLMPYTVDEDFEFDLVFGSIDDLIIQ